MPARLASIEDFMARLRNQCCRGIDPSDRFAAELMVREALANAVQHGCGSDPERHVRCTIRIGRGRVLVLVADDGPGFDWRAAMRRGTQDTACSGRGLAIVRRYATRVRFNRRGNIIAIWKRL